MGKAAGGRKRCWRVGFSDLKQANDAAVAYYKRIEEVHRSSLGDTSDAETARRDLEGLGFDCANLVGEMLKIEAPR